jgi:GDPmannose 4,6-dehydratase
MNSKKIVVVTGVGGQDGSLMVAYLLRNTDHIIVGCSRDTSGEAWLSNGSPYRFVNVDITKRDAVVKILSVGQPDYFLNFAAQTEVKKSWDDPVNTWEVNTDAVLTILDGIRSLAPKCKFLNCGSSEEFGEICYSPQDESHPIRPVSPYGMSKAAARQIVNFYRSHYNMFAIQPWFFNHESQYRGKEFVTRKITSNVVDIYYKIVYDMPITPIELGNLNAKRDWSHAEDVIDATWKMINSDIPSDYVVASGQSHTIKEFVEAAFNVVGIEGSWHGFGVDEYFWYESGPKPLSSHEGVLVKVNPSYYRPVEVKDACGNSNRLRENLKWEPKFGFHDIVLDMVENDHMHHLFPSKNIA